MNREVHVRLREGVRVRSPRATRLLKLEKAKSLTICMTDLE